MLTIERTENKEVKLNDGQKKAADMIIKAVRQKEGGFILVEGEGGSGKSFAVLHAIKQAIDQDILEPTDVLAVLPTHTLKDVWIKNLVAAEMEGVGALTTCKALKHFPTAIDNGAQILVPAVGDEDDLPYAVVIVDECYSVPETLICAMYSYGSVLWVMLGDLAQLPPIGEKMSALQHLITHYAGKTRLTEQMRQKDLTLYSMIEEIKAKGKKFLPPKHLVLSRRQFDEEMIERAKEAEGDYDQFQVITYTNKASRQCSDYIRSELYGVEDADYVVVGEYIKIKALGTPGGRTLIPARTVVKVTDVREDKTSFTVEWEGDFYTCPIDVNNKVEESYLNAKKVNAAKIWNKHYALERSFVQFISPFLTTCHSAQGKTFGTVFLYWGDLMLNRSEPTIFYTGASRAKDALYFRMR